MRQNELDYALALGPGARPSRAAAMPTAAETRRPARRDAVARWLGPGGDPLVSSGTVCPHDRGRRPLSLASGTRDTTVAEGAGGGRATRQSPAPAGRGGAAWAVARRVAARAAPAGRPLESLGSPTPGHGVAPLGDAHRRDRPDADRRVVLEGGSLGGMPAGGGRTPSPEDVTTAPSRGDRRALRLQCKPARCHTGCCITTWYHGKARLILAQRERSVGIEVSRVALALDVEQRSTVLLPAIEPERRGTPCPAMRRPSWHPTEAANSCGRPRRPRPRAGSSCWMGRPRPRGGGWTPRIPPRPKLPRPAHYGSSSAERSTRPPAT